MTKLDEIGRRYGTDKSSNVHNYCEKYEKYLPWCRDERLKILEIGVLQGQSLQMWSDYYPNARIVGADINPSCFKRPTDRITIEIGSQTDPYFLHLLSMEYGSFNLIIDDGSHQNNDVIYTFENLFKSLKSGGIYIIEDVCTSYWTEYGGGRYLKGSIMEYFKGITDEVNFFGEKKEVIINGEIIGVADRSDDALLEQFMRKGYSYIGTFIESINFLNSIIIITKR